MTHSLFFPLLVSTVVSYIISFEVARELSRFCKMARRSKIVGPRYGIYQGCGAGAVCKI